MGKLQDREIAELAYELYEKSGWAHGKDEEHWLEAERILDARSSKGVKKSAKKPAKSSAKPVAEATGAVQKRSAKAAKKSTKERTKAIL